MKNKNILIIGGASGLGLEITKLFIKNKDNVFFTYNKSINTANRITKINSNSKSFFCDFTQPDSVDSFCKSLSDLDIDVLINNGYLFSDIKHFHKTDPVEFSRSFCFNIVSTIKITQKCLTVFRKKKNGKIINILSSFIKSDNPFGLSIYCSEKNYMKSLSNSWAIENRKFNISSVCISPSTMETNMINGLDPRIIENQKAINYKNSFIDPLEVAKSVLFLSHLSNHINNQNFYLSEY
jgi:3-oxoacyl-[acyl-carrier protein] reductase